MNKKIIISVVLGLTLGVLIGFIAKYLGSDNIPFMVLALGFIALLTWNVLLEGRLAKLSLDEFHLSVQIKILRDYLLIYADNGAELLSELDKMIPNIKK